MIRVSQIRPSPVAEVLADTGVCVCRVWARFGAHLAAHLDQGWCCLCWQELQVHPTGPSCSQHPWEGSSTLSSPFPGISQLLPDNKEVISLKTKHLLSNGIPVNISLREIHKSRREISRWNCWQKFNLRHFLMAKKGSPASPLHTKIMYVPVMHTCLGSREISAMLHF